MKKLIYLATGAFLVFSFLRQIEISYAFSSSYQVPRSVFTEFTRDVDEQRNLRMRISSTLQKVGKNLILESTRGNKEVSPESCT